MKNILIIVLSLFTLNAYGLQIGMSRTQALPHSEESERAILGAILISPDSFPYVETLLSGNEFYFLKHTAIFKAMKELHSNNSTIDQVTLCAQLGEKEFSKIGGHAYLAGLELDLPCHNFPDLETYTKTIRNRFTRRNIIKLSAKLHAMSLDEIKTEDILSAASQGIDKISKHSSSASKLIPLQDLLEQYQPGDFDDPVLPTGIIGLDKILNGGLRERLYGFSSRPGHGKSSLLSTIAINIAQFLHREGRDEKILYFSLEMPEKEMIHRILAQESKLPFTDIESHAVFESSNHIERLEDARERLMKLNIEICGHPEVTVPEIKAELMIKQMHEKIAVGFIDYLGRIPFHTRYPDKRDNIGALVLGIKTISALLKIPIVLAIQSSREADREKPSLSQLADSADGERECDIVGFLIRRELYNRKDPNLKGLADLVIEKHRSGKT